MLTQTVRTDMTAAMKARDQLRVDTLRGALSSFTNELVTKGRKPTEELTDDEAIVVLKRLAKQRKDSAEQFEKGGRAELGVTEASGIGKLTGAVMKEFAGRADGNDVKAVLASLFT